MEYLYNVVLEESMSQICNLGPGYIFDIKRQY